MRKQIITISILLFIFVSKGITRIVEQCELAIALTNIARVSRTFVPHLVCAAQYESARNTAKVRELPNQTINYGLFQINSKDCKLCNLQCDKLITNNINDSVICANKIFELKGLQYWPQWMRNCKQQEVPNLATCFEQNPPSPNIVTVNNPLARFNLNNRPIRV